jgi:hypothetical protein
VYAKAPAGATIDRAKVGMPKPEDITLCMGYCCQLVGLYTSCPECMGCSAGGTLCCLEETRVCCKSIAGDSDNSNHDACCLLAKMECLCIPVNTLCKVQNQIFCCYYACALLCDEEVPCTCGQLGLMCCLNWACKPQCCPKYSDVLEQSNPGAAAAGQQQGTSTA